MPTQSEFEFSKDFKGKATEKPNTPLIVFEKIDPEAVIPVKSHPGDAGFDLTAISFEKKDFTVIAHTGLRMQLPEGYEAQVRSRSGLAAKGIAVVNSPGTIDNGYRGEIMVILGSFSGHPPFLTSRKGMHSGSTFITAGERVAQLVIQPIFNMEIIEGKVSDETERGAGGLGSTGK